MGNTLGAGVEGVEGVVADVPLVSRQYQGRKVNQWRTALIYACPSADMIRAYMPT